MLIVFVLPVLCVAVTAVLKVAVTIVLCETADAATVYGMMPMQEQVLVYYPDNLHSQLLVVTRTAYKLINIDFWKTRTLKTMDGALYASPPE